MTMTTTTCNCTNYEKQIAQTLWEEFRQFGTEPIIQRAASSVKMDEDILKTWCATKSLPKLAEEVQQLFSTFETNITKYHNLKWDQIPQEASENVTKIAHFLNDFAFLLLINAHKEINLAKDAKTITFDSIAKEITTIEETGILENIDQITLDGSPFVPERIQSLKNLQSWTFNILPKTCPELASDLKKLNTVFFSKLTVKDPKHLFLKNLPRPITVHFPDCQISKNLIPQHPLSSAPILKME